MRAARLFAPGDVRVLDEPDPDPGPGETLVEVTSVGLCGSDLHWFAEGAIGDATLSRPLVLGHEMAGVTRDGVRVAIDPAIPCGGCEQCLRGHPNLCPTVVFAGHGGCDGGLRQRMAWPTHRLHPLPDAIGDDEGALLEPLGVALHALDLAHLRLGDTAAVVGCGPIGLMLIQLARLAGATRVLAAEPLPHRLAAALERRAEPVGAAFERRAEPVAAASERRAEPVAAASERTAEPAQGATDQADVVFEVSGSDGAVDTALRLAKPGSRVVLVGIPDGDRTGFPASVARRKGLSLVLARRMGEVYPRAIDLAARRLVDLAPLVSATFPLAEAGSAMTAAAAREGLKIVVRPQG